MLCSPGAGAVALVLTGSDRVSRHPSTPVYLRAAEMRTRRPGTLETFSRSFPADVTPAPTYDAAAATFAASGLTPGEIDIVQVQDTDAGSELIHLAECGFCAHGEQEELVQAGETSIKGVLPVNTDGGCLANGEPIGASGLRQIYEVVLQLRGQGGVRQVPGRPKHGFTHVYGAPGVSACTVLSTEG
jgi:acetyl-CoA acetyltransferase